MKLTISCPYCYGEDFNIPKISDNNEHVCYIRCNQCNKDIEIYGVEFEINYIEKVGERCCED